MYPKQRDALFTDARYSLVEGATKTGKTICSLVWLITSALAKPGIYWWVAPVYAQTDIAFRRGLRMCGDPAVGAMVNRSEKSIGLPNGSMLRFKSAEHPDNLYGEDVSAVVVDEASRAREEAWAAVRSTLTATRGKARLIGNVRGRSWHWRLARQAEAGAADMEYHKITAWDAVDAGVLAREEVESAKRELPLVVFRELYECVPSDDGGNPFGLKAIDDAIIGGMGSGPAVCYGVDLAKAQDYTAVVGLNELGDVCYYADWTRRSWDYTMRRLRGIIGTAPALIDSTGVGDPILEDLAMELPQVEGFHFTAPSKQRLMEGLALALQNGEVRFPEGKLANELRLYEYEVRMTSGRVTGVRYSAPPGEHDDAVCALALAVQGWNDAARAYNPYIAAEVGITELDIAKQAGAAV